MTEISIEKYLVPDYSGIGRKRFEDLLRFKMSPINFNLVMDAYRQSKTGHRGQKRDNGNRYFDHPKRVALIVISELAIYDHEMIIAALMHDIMEDNVYMFGANFEEARDAIQRMFGSKRVAQIIHTVSKNPCRPEEKITRNERYFSGIMESDIRTKIIKLADRLDNLRDLGGFSFDRREHYKEETDEYILPIALDLLSSDELDDHMRSRIRHIYDEMCHIIF